jgi:phospholipid/cholesterol/gamma-HCH transport system substrate-binding protein
MYTKLEKLIATTQEAANNLNEIAAQLSSGKGTLGKFLADDELYKSLVSAAQRLDNLSRKLEKGEGTLGKLFQDDTLYKEIKRTVININRAAVGTQEVLPTTVLGTIGSAVLQ